MPATMRAAIRGPRSGRPNPLRAAILSLSPVAYYPLDDLSTTSKDFGANALDGTGSGGFIAKGWAGDDNRGYPDFGAGGSGGRVAVADNNVFSANTSSGLTIVAFIRPESAELAATTRRLYVGKGSSGQYEYGLSVSNTVAGRLAAGFFTPAGAHNSNEYFDGALVANKWNFVACATDAPVFDQRFDLYANSNIALASSKFANTNTAYANGTAALHIGWMADNTANNFWNGGIAHVAFFAGRMSAANIGTIITAARQSGWRVP